MHTLRHERKVRNLRVLGIAFQPRDVCEIGSADLEAERKGVGVRHVAHADQRDPELVVMFDSIERPIIGTVVLLRFEKAVGVALWRLS